jgi:NADH:ubiquinone oxidoreductase subunit K
VDYLLLSLVLMAIGIYGLVTKFRLLKTVISIEILATATTMNFVLLVSSTGRVLGEALLVLAFSTDICMSSIVVALLVFLSRKFGTTDIRKLARLVQGEEREAIDQQSESEGT